jgi:hypothetical protein
MAIHADNLDRLPIPVSPPGLDLPELPSGSEITARRLDLPITSCPSDQGCDDRRPLSQMLPAMIGFG